MRKVTLARMACIVCGACLATSSASSAQTFTNLRNFIYPYNPAVYGFLIEGSDGNFYGTTASGGAMDDGTVFKISSEGNITGLHSFCSQTNCADGAFPFAGLVQGTDGNFYGTTNIGGVNGYGTVFKISPAGGLTTLHSFDSIDGANPFADLVQGTNGNFYGTTNQGGANGYGTVFRITPAGRLTTLHSFHQTDGANPSAGLVQATDGNFYGTTNEGGSQAQLITCASIQFSNGCGTVFRITPGGRLTTLYNFCSLPGCRADGANPYAGLVQAFNGTFYGATGAGGINGDGTFFSLSVGLGAFVETQ